MMITVYWSVTFDDFVRLYFYRNAKCQMSIENTDLLSPGGKNFEAKLILTTILDQTLLYEVDSFMQVSGVKVMYFT